MFSSSVLYLAASLASKELNSEKIEYDMHQGDKLGASAVGELSRRKEQEKLHDHSSYLYFTILMLKVC